MASSAHFSAAEIGYVPPLLERNAELLLQLAEQYRALLGGRPWRVTGPVYRSAARNAAAGGSPTSQHLTASALDFAVSGWSILDGGRALIAAYQAGGPHFGQLVIHLAAPSHLHLSLPNRASGRRDEILVESAKGVFRSWDGSGSIEAAPQQIAPDADREPSTALPLLVGAGVIGALHG